MPKYITSEDITKLYEMGVRTVIDLRCERELFVLNKKYSYITSEYLKHGITYINTPIENRKRPGKSQEENLNFYGTFPNNKLLAILKLFRMRAEKGAVMFHCWTGKDRTGIIAAILMMENGLTRDEAVKDYITSAKNLGLDLEDLNAPHEEYLNAALSEYQRIKDKPIVIDNADIIFMSNILSEISRMTGISKEDVQTKIDFDYWLMADQPVTAEQIMKIYDLKKKI